MTRLTSLGLLAGILLGGCRVSTREPPAEPATGSTAQRSTGVLTMGNDLPPRTTAGRGAAASKPAEPPAPRDDVTSRMRAHFDGLRELERSIVRGDLDQARERAAAIAFEREGLDAPSWAPYLARMKEAASTLAQAESVPDACRAEARLAAECAGCHVANRATVVMLIAPEPPDGATLAERMARHQWAADRLWQAVIGLSDEAWREGLAVLAETPLPPAAFGDDADRRTRMETSARSLQQQARQVAPVKTAALRARAYGQLLITCSGCHTYLPDGSDDW